MEFLFMLIGLGFFIWIVWHVEASEERTYQRKLNEQREFGYQATQPKPAKEPQHKK